MVQNTKKQDLESEIEWYESGHFYIDTGHWTSHRLFASRERHWLAGQVEKIRFYGYLSRYISTKPYYGKAKVLIAPVGVGDDIRYLEGLYAEMHGIDISEIAVSQCPAHIVTKRGDILQSGYESESFDIILCPLFLHHIHNVGFTPFLNEYYRILRHGGVLAIHEPSVFFPPSRFACFLRRFMGNVTGLVPDERPIYPPSLTKHLKQIGLVNVQYHGLSFSHVRYPVFLQALNLLFDWPWRLLWPFKLFSSGIAWYCEKQTR
ncbi:MAG: class I SAM-dependent methyltransferase [Planctomycetota bacterium]